MTMNDYYNLLMEETLKRAYARKALFELELTETERYICLSDAQFSSVMKEAYRNTKQTDSWLAVGKIVDEWVRIKD